MGQSPLKSVLSKCIDAKRDWAAQIPFVLFILRQMPNSDSLFSPFDLVYGFRVRTPLDALYHGIFECEVEKLNVCEWVSGVAERLELLRDCASLNAAKAKEKRVELMNKGSKMRMFSVGDMVLYRIPGLSCKLADSWEGPYVVSDRVGTVNYRIHREGKHKNQKVVHVNCLKKYVECRSIGRLDVVIEVEQERGHRLSGVCEGYCTEDLETLLSEYKSIFSDKPGDTTQVEMMIETGDNAPFRQTPYSVPIGIRDKVKKELDLLEEAGIIERSDSPWASPLVPVKKPDGSVRLCVDFRRLNSATVREPYYIPGLDEIVHKVGQARVLSKVDLTKGFHQVSVKVEDRAKTAFVCPFGKFQYCKMPFGLCNAPSVFQRLMDVVLSDCVDCSCVYIDDVLIMSENWREHLVHSGRVFECLRKAGLTCKSSKCEFGKATLEFLGHVVGDGVLSVPEARVLALRDHPRSKTKKQLRAFLGVVNFYRRFIRGFHQWSYLLTPSTSKSAPAVVGWTSLMLEAFDQLKVKLCNHVCLCIPCDSDMFILETDASSSGVGAVLSVLREGALRPAAFSRQLHGAQTRYSAQELEGLGLYEAIRFFAFYLYGRKFKVITDHKPLVSMMTAPQHNRRKGEQNIVADCLSRGAVGEEHAEADDTHQLKEGGGDVGGAT